MYFNIDYSGLEQPILNIKEAKVSKIRSIKRKITKKKHSFKKKYITINLDYDESINYW